MLNSIIGAKSDEVQGRIRSWITVVAVTPQVCYH